NELLQLTVVRERLEEEQQRIAHEKQALEDERRQVAALRERYESGNHPNQERPDRPETATVALRNSSSDAIRRSDAGRGGDAMRSDVPPDSLSFRHYGGVGGADLIASAEDLRASSPISSSLIQRLPKGRGWLSWKVVVPSVTLIAATVLFILNPWSRATEEPQKPPAPSTTVSDRGSGTDATSPTVAPKLLAKAPTPRPRTKRVEPTLVQAKTTPPILLQRRDPGTDPSPTRTKTAPPAPKPKPSPKGGPTIKAPEKQSPPALVYLRIETDPDGAKVMVNGKSIGTTPLVRRSKPSSKALDVVLVKKGYHARKFTLKQDQNGTYSFALKRSTKVPRIKRKRKSNIFGLPQVP
ncbi:MAG: PEGA domain-containing protein, partial [Myxococcales bacterium]|nr:PEGA domain-containing protein [Myxococcales bacterium]